MIDALYGCWAFNNVDFVADLQYSVSIDFFQNIFKVHYIRGFSPQDMRRLLNHAWSTFSWCYYGTSIHFPDASIFFFYNHFTLLDSWKYFAFVGTNDLLGFVEIEGVLSLAGIKDLLNFVGIKDLPGFTGIKDLPGFAFLESRIS